MRGDNRIRDQRQERRSCSVAGLTATTTRVTMMTTVVAVAVAILAGTLVMSTILSGENKMFLLTVNAANICDASEKDCITETPQHGQQHHHQHHQHHQQPNPPMLSRHGTDLGLIQSLSTTTLLAEASDDSNDLDIKDRNQQQNPFQQQASAKKMVAHGIEAPPAPATVIVTERDETTVPTTTNPEDRESTSQNHHHHHHHPHRRRGGPTREKKSVVIVGAGVAGLTAARRLLDYHRAYQQQQKQQPPSHRPPVPFELDVTILEATSVWGGRVRKDDSRTFARDFDLDLGASWILDPSLLPLMVGIQPPVAAAVTTTTTDTGGDNNNSDLQTSTFPTVSLATDPTKKMMHISYDGTEHNDWGMQEEMNHLWNNFTWYDFIHHHILEGGDNMSMGGGAGGEEGRMGSENDQPQHQPRIVYNCPVESIVVEKDSVHNNNSNDSSESGQQRQQKHSRHSSNHDQQSNPHTTKVLLTCRGGDHHHPRTFSADYVIVTAPLAVLPSIRFDPPLPDELLHHTTKMWRGFKVFLEFSYKFYYDFFEFQSFAGGTGGAGDADGGGGDGNGDEFLIDDGELEFWDYGFFQQQEQHRNEQPQPQQHVLAGYYIGGASDQLYHRVEATSSSSNRSTTASANLTQQLINEVLGDLDRAFQGHATKAYTGRYVFLNWTDEQFVQGTYTSSALYEGPLSILQFQDSSMDEDDDVVYNPQIQLAGEAFPIPANHNGFVCGASLSGKHAAEVILDDILHWQRQEQQHACLRQLQQPHRRRQGGGNDNDEETIHHPCEDGAAMDVDREGIFTTLHLW